MAVTLLVGTTKGAFLVHSEDRKDWSVKGPFCGGWTINHVIGDPGTGEIWAAGGNEWFGAGIWTSRDGGETWSCAKLAGGQMDSWLRENPEMAAHFGMEPPTDAPHTGEIDNFWSLGRSNGTLYAGAKPAQLFESKDRGETWSRVQSLSDHPSSDSWQPGGAGLTLHTIVSDPGNPLKLWLGISAAGVFATEDGGKTWERRNRRSNDDHAHDDHIHMPGEDPNQVGHCVHNMVRAGASGDLLYQQNHHGVFRSPDGGRSWTEISQGLPSTFGFPIAVHPRDPRTIWIVPMNGDSQGRFPPDASAKVWRSRDGGENWEGIQAGLPAKYCYFTVLRQAMATDREPSVGVYFGTNSGSVFASTDEGDSWTEAARHLPTVLSVETLTT